MLLYGTLLVVLLPMLSRVLPRLPILGWSAFKGTRPTTVPSLLDAPQVVYTQSGRASIALALRLLNVRPGDRVLVPTYHCPTMIQPVVAAGAEPVFYSLDARGCPSLQYLKAADLRGVRAIIAAHYFGVPQPMGELRRFCDERSISLIEDCAHALFGMSDGRPVGSWGEYAIASLTKFFPVPEGGCLVSHQRPVLDVVLPERALVEELKTALDAVEMGARHHGFPGLNSALIAVFNLKNALRHEPTPQQTTQDAAWRRSGTSHNLLAVDPVRVTRVARWIAQHAPRSHIVAVRRRNFSHLAQLLANVPGVRVLHKVLPEGAVPYVFPVLVEGADEKYHRLRASGIPIYRWDDIWPTTPSLAGDVGQVWTRSVFQLGCHQDLSLQDLESIAQQVRRVCIQ
jgi:perosamine synthetase